jgi:hypothetical protein
MRLPWAHLISQTLLLLRLLSLEVLHCADGVPPASETYALIGGDVGASPYDVAAGEYVCHPGRLVDHNTCLAVGVSSSVVATPHPINDTRALAPDKWRQVVSKDGTLKRLPTPWRNGDRLARSSVEVTASERNYGGEQLPVLYPFEKGSIAAQLLTVHFAPRQYPSRV